MREPANASRIESLIRGIGMAARGPAIDPGTFRDKVDQVVKDLSSG